MDYSPAQNGRSAEFNTGMTGSNNIATSLSTSASDFNAKAAQAIKDPFSESLTPHSVLQPYMKSANGFAQSDASRITPQGLLPSQSGSSASTYARMNPQFGTHLQY